MQFKKNCLIINHQYLAKCFRMLSFVGHYDLFKTIYSTKTQRFYGYTPATYTKQVYHQGKHHVGVGSCINGEHCRRGQKPQRNKGYLIMVVLYKELCSLSDTFLHENWLIPLILSSCNRSSGGVDRFDSRSRLYDFRDWLSPASKLRYDLKIA